MGRHEPASRGRFTRLRAVLAGCLVLGVGGAVTLAAWTDQEHASGSFTAGEFGIEGATDGSTFSEHPDAGSAAELEFTLPEATQMVPGSVVYAPLTVRTTESSVAGYVRFTAEDANTAGLGAYLQYGVRVVPGTECNATTFGAGQDVVPVSSPLSQDGDGAWRALAAGGGDQITFCFEVTLPSGTTNAAQGETLDALWVIEASTDTSG